MVTFSVTGQNLTAANNAVLQVYMQEAGGQDVVLSSNQMIVRYDGLHMEGELDLGTLMTENQDVKSILDSAYFRTITFSGDIPPGQFQFQNTLDYSFSVEVEMNAGDRESRFVMNFLVSNRKNDDINNFAITCSATLSLSQDLGVGVTRLNDKVSFQFFQTLRAIN
jgi:hypothetical protein